MSFDPEESAAKFIPAYRRPDPPTTFPDVKPCPDCGATKLHWHHSTDHHVVLTHNPGCKRGRITVLKNGSEHHKKWNAQETPTK